MRSFKTKTIALIASSLIVAVAGLSFATTPAEASRKMKTHKNTAAAKKRADAKSSSSNSNLPATGSKPVQKTK